MSNENQNKGVNREFFLSSLSIDNRTSVFILMFLILITGFGAYRSMPKENFPEISIPTVYIGVAYPGNSPEDMENLITRHIEKEINSIKDVSEIRSTSIQDYTTIIVEFDFDVNVAEALANVKDAVDKAKSELPSDLDREPNVFELDMSNIPVININLSGENYTLEQLKENAEYLQDEIEALKEVSKVEIRGSIDKELNIAVDNAKMEAAKVSFKDIEDAVNYENMTVSAGDILVDGSRRTIRLVGEFTGVQEIENLVVKSDYQKPIFLRDIATVTFRAKETDSYARINGSPVVSLDVKKRNGENLIDAVDKIMVIVENAKKSHFDKDLDVTITNDTSLQTKLQVSNLENSIISGVILVVLVLLFFLGLRNALFVGIAIPLSMLMGFLILNIMGVTLNMMVLYSLVLALGMLVDNGIVVVENVYRLLQEGKDLITASKEGVGEVAVPIIASTATTLAAFFPLIFWQSIMGEFMKYLPITLIIVLSSSLFVALVINPVLTSYFMKLDEETRAQRTNVTKFLLTYGVGVVVGAILVFVGLKSDIKPMVVVGNLIGIFSSIAIINRFILSPLAEKFQENFLPVLENWYENTVSWTLQGFRPVWVFIGMFVLLFGSLFYFGANMPEVVFFPEGKPNYVNVFIEFPTGTDIDYTNEQTRKIEDKVIKAMGKYGLGIGKNVESILINVGAGTSDPTRATETQGVTPNKSKITVSFIEYEKRTEVEMNGKMQRFDTELAMNEIRNLVGKIPGAVVSVDRDPQGPPVGPPINIAISGDEFDELIKIHNQVRTIINKAVADGEIVGLEKLKSDLDEGKPELLFNLNRAAVRTYGLSTGQVAGALRTALFGKEISSIKFGDEDYPIMLRFKREQRYDLETLKNMLITFRDQSDGKTKQVPVSAIADVQYSSSLGAVRRIDLDRVVTLYSNVTSEGNANEIIAKLKNELTPQKLRLPEGYNIDFTGEQEEQAKSMSFLVNALMIAVFVIFMIIVAQFNSVTAPVIIMLSVVFSFIGVFLGLAVFGDQFVVIMTMIGIISLAGIVVNNAIVLMDFTELTRDRFKVQLGMKKTDRLSKEKIIEAIVYAGKTRLRPVLLTAVTTVLGLIPLAVGINIDFEGFLSTMSPNFYIGGDNVMFWGPLSWTVIYGLTFSTFLTLVIVPVMILLFDLAGHKFSNLFKKN
ncbi:MAG: efflux RND transporter permease subunit [Bacteroidetes bacterium]|nr:efflux RND transporter permease subunit [Bacteroidota bacterium]